MSDRCEHYKYWPVGVNGPEEHSCRHPDSKGGDCAREECPLFPEPVKPCVWCGDEIPEGAVATYYGDDDYHPRCFEESGVVYAQ